jgi:hypothetical protein
LRRTVQSFTRSNSSRQILSSSGGRVPRLLRFVQNDNRKTPAVCRCKTIRVFSLSLAGPHQMKLKERIKKIPESELESINARFDDFAEGRFV